VQEAIFDRNGKLIFLYLQSHLPIIKEKLSQPLLATQIRFVVQSSSREKSLQIAKHTSAFFRQSCSPGGNELIPLQNNIDVNKHLNSILSRTAFRSGMLVSAQELSAIVHLPSDAVKSQKLCRDDNRTKLAPQFATQGTIILGENQHNGQKQIIKLLDTERIKHLWLTGSSGSGKTSLVNFLVAQDIEAGNGVTVIEPHGDSIENIIARIPERRLKDVILLDPGDEEFPVGFNILQAQSELEKILLSSDLVAIFRRFSSSWGDVINSILHNAILAFLSSTKGGSLLDLKHFLVDRGFREEFLKTVADEEIRFYWQKEFPALVGKPHAPLLTRLDLFLRSKLIRNIIAQKDNKLDFRRIMNERKILLVKLTHGAIGEENAHLLGSLIMTKLYQAALSRQNMPENSRVNHFIYLDEAHHIIVRSLSLLLSGGRKFSCSLLFSHQETRQITSRDAELLSSLQTNCFTRICFRTDSDAEMLAKGFSFFTAKHLKNLGVGEAIVRLEQSRYDFNLKTFPLEKVSAEIAAQKKTAVIEHTRQTYAKPKAEIEAEKQKHQQISRNVSEVRLEQNISTKNQSNETVEDRKLNQKPIIPDTIPQTNHGRGGQHHCELQAVIKRMAESYGFAVEIEKSVLDGAGFVDVSLEKENLKIACEVSVTSTPDYETRNILKCLTAGYNYAFVVVSNQKKLPAINAKLLSAIPFELQDKVKTVSLTGLLTFLRELVFLKETIQKKAKKTTGQRLNFTEACEFFGVGSSTLYRWIQEGRIPFYRPGREYQFDRDELVLIGKHDLSGKRKASVKLSPLKIEKNIPKGKKQQDERYRKLLKLE
jgi:excisionase family DNA binding protein